MDDASVKDTVAYGIVRQLLDHIWGSEVELSDSEFLDVYKTYMSMGGSWEQLIKGSMDKFDLLKDVLESYVDIKSNPDEYGL